MRSLSVRFLTRQGCHLCDQARPYVTRAARLMNVAVVEVDIDTDPELVARYGLRIPVILGAHDTVLAEGVIDDARLLREALKAGIDR
ncbi:MAG TPA: glutaredoxin family protein [Acidimicrobiia bacterium]|nr:glutaredoxin family protein [Acidimicrobiia bacterium]